MALGQIFKTTRTNRGYSISEVADRIKMSPQMIADLEQEDYSRIAALIYGKGYVRKYAEFLGLDYRPLVEEFKNAFGNDNVEKPSVPLESFDPESGMITKVVPQTAPRQSQSIQQPVATPIVQTVAAPKSSPAVEVSQQPSVAEEAKSQIQESANNSLFADFESASEPTAQSKESIVGLDSSAAKSDTFVAPGQPAVSQLTPSMQPLNTTGNLGVHPRYTLPPEKYTPRTTTFKPEQLASAPAPEPIALSVAPFSYPEPDGVSVESDDVTPVVNVSDKEEEDSIFSKPSGSPFRTVYSRDAEKEVSNSKKSFSFAEILNKIIAYLKDVFSKDSGDDLTNTLARKQRRLGFCIVVVIIVVLIAIFSFSGSSDQVETTENQTEQVVENNQEEIPNLVNNNEDSSVEEFGPVEVVQIFSTPKGFVD